MSENKEKYEEALEKSKLKANHYIKNPEKITHLIKKTMNMSLSKQGPLGKLLDEIQLLHGLLSDFIKGNYKEIPLGSIIAIVAGLIYLVSSIDIIPDFIPILGLTDDAIIIKMVLKQVQTDLYKYKQFKESQVIENTD